MLWRWQHATYHPTLCVFGAQIRPRVSEPNTIPGLRAVGWQHAARVTPAPARDATGLRAIVFRGVSPHTHIAEAAEIEKDDGMRREVGRMDPGVDARWMLQHLLQLAVMDAKRCDQLIDEAIGVAGVCELPTTSHELVGFVERYLAPSLVAIVGPNLASAVISELQFQVDRFEAAPEPRSGVRGRVVEGSTPPRRHTSSERLLAVIASTPPSEPTPKRAARKTVAAHLLYCDRVVRATLARALVNAGFDMTVHDHEGDLMSAVHRTDAPCVVLAEGRLVTGHSFGRALLATKPNAALLVLTDQPLSDDHDGRIAHVSSGTTQVEIVSEALRLRGLLAS